MTCKLMNILFPLLSVALLSKHPTDTFVANMFNMRNNVNISFICLGTALRVCLRHLNDYILLQLRKVLFWYFHMDATHVHIPHGVLMH